MSHLCPLPFPTLLRQRFMRQHNHMTHHVGLRQHILDRLLWTAYVSISHVIKNTSHYLPIPTLLRQHFMRQHNHLTHHVGLRQHILDRLRQHLSHDKDHESPLPFPTLLRQHLCVSITT